MGLHDAASSVSGAVKDFIVLVISVLGAILGLAAFASGAGAFALLSGTVPTFSAIGFLGGSLSAFVIFCITGLTVTFVNSLE